MQEKKFLRLVGINCPPELDAEFNQWYNNVHLPMLMKFPGIKKATRAVIDKPLGDLPQYLAIYEFDSREDFEEWLKSPELAAVAKETEATWSEKKYQRKFFVEYKVMKTWQQDT